MSRPTHSAAATVFEHSRDAVLVVDGARCVASLNRAATRLFGLQTEWVGRPLSQLLPGWSPPESAPAGDPPALDLVWQPPGESRRPARHFRVRTVPLEGAEAGWALMLEDATASREVESDLRRQKEFLESVVVNSPVAIVTISREFRVLSWNPASERLFGFSSEEALGANILELVAGADSVREEGQRAQREALRRGRVHSVTRRVRKDGTVLDVELLALPVSVGGEQVGFIAIYHDITDLQRALQAAETANQAKSLFLATMSHEIRTPMNAIIGMTGLLLDTHLSLEQRDFVSTVRQSGESLLALLNDLLDFSKIEAGRLELEHHPFDVRQCVESVLDLLAPRASEKGLDLGCHIAPETPQMLVGDASRLRQVLLNLVGNGLKFTEQGGVAVSVKVTRTPEDATEGFELLFTVQDTGLGIAEDRQAGLFQPFSQLDASVARRFGGTGLGLVISKRLVEAMGGRVWVESDGPGRGSTFHFTFSAPAAPPAPVLYLNPEQPLLRGRRVLIVDDNAISRRLLGLQLESWGIEPVETGSGAEALGWLEGRRPLDIVIVDHQMPLLDGPALAAVMRQRPELRALPLLLLTSLGRRDQQPAGLFTSVLPRPVKASQLYDALVTCLSDDVERAQAHVVPEPARPGGLLGERLPLRILLVEDNATNQKLALLVLERLGYRAEVAGNGREALRALSRQRYDIAFMDMQMPEMDGLEATRAIRQQIPASEQPWIIAMTANAMESDRRQCLAAGMDDYLSKPLRVEALVAALQQSRPRYPRAPTPVAAGTWGVPAPRPPPEPVSSQLPEVPGLEPSALLRLRDGLGEQADRVLPELIDTALQNMPGLLGEARTALGRGNADDLGRAMHTLKSNAAYFGATALESLCRDIEHRADSNALDGMAMMLGRCEVELERTRGLLERLRRSVAA
ncbi:response regulator [Myxococcaceae bacterium GXIMD 01537]